MKVAILGPYPADQKAERIKGGVQQVIVNMVKGLSRFKDLDIHVITADSSIDKDMDFVLDGVNVHAVAMIKDRRFGNLRLYSDTRKRLRRKISEIKPDLIHSHILGYYTLAALQGGNKNVVVSTHGVSKSDWGIRKDMVDSIRMYLHDYTSARCAKKAENIIVNSPYARPYLRRFGEKKIYELNNPISERYFDMAINGSAEKTVLFAGNICEEKGVMTLLEALNILRFSYGHLRVRFAGPFVNDNFYADIVRFIKKNRLEGMAELLGHLSEDELEEEYRNASIFVLPSQQDVAPLALLQAMAAGKAVISTRVGGIPDIVDDGVNGILVEKNDPHALADKIVILMKDDKLRKRLGSNARDKVSADYRITSVADRLYGIYKELKG